MRVPLLDLDILAFLCILIKLIKMKAACSLIVLVFLHVTFYTNAQQLKPIPRINLNLPPIGAGGNKPFSWSGKGLTGNNGVNGLSLTGKWKPPGTGHSFSGTGNWQNGKGFGGSVGGSFGIGRGTSLNFNVGGGGGGLTSASIGLKMKFRRRRSVLKDALRI